MPDLPPSARVTVAPSPAACAALAASGSYIMPVAARCALLRTSARSMPVVSESPPAPGLSWVSAITIGFVARLRQLHGVAHAVVGRPDLAVEVILMAFDEGGDRIGRCIGIGLGPAIGHDARAAMDEIGGREAECKGECRYGLILKRGKLPVDALCRLVIGALPADRNQERRLPEGFCQSLFRLQQ